MKSYKRAKIHSHFSSEYYCVTGSNHILEPNFLPNSENVPSEKSARPSKIFIAVHMERTVQHRRNVSDVCSRLQSCFLAHELHLCTATDSGRFWVPKTSSNGESHEEHLLGQLSLLSGNRRRSHSQASSSDRK
jgi:hypothetical protein